MYNLKYYTYIYYIMINILQYILSEYHNNFIFVHNITYCYNIYWYQVISNL